MNKKELKAALDSEGVEKVTTEIILGAGANGEDIARNDTIEDDHIRGLAIVVGRDIQTLRDALED